MWKVGIMAVAVPLFLCLSAFCEEEVTIPRGYAIGFGMGQQDGDVSIGLNVTSRYLHVKRSPNPRSWCAFRLSGDYRTKTATPIGGTADSVFSYFSGRVGFVGSAEVFNMLRMYEEVGCVSVFPSAELASSKNPSFGLYGYIGSEVFVGKNLLTKNTSIFMEIGIEGFLTEHRFDKLVNSPFVGWGATVRAGGRFYI